MDSLRAKIVSRGLPSASLPSPAARGAYVGWLDAICGGARERRLLLHYLFGAESSNDLTGQQWDCLRRWLRPRCHDGVWSIAEECRREAQSLIRLALIEAGQLTLFDE